MISKIAKIALTAALALVVSITLGCEKKSGGKTADSPKQTTEEAADTAQAEAEADKADGGDKTAAAQSGTFIDPRDSAVYKTVKMPDGKTWMAENLNVKMETSWCYENKEYNCQKYGRLYNWMTARMACPYGYRLPSNEEWAELVSAAGSETAGKKLKAKNGWKDFGDASGNGTDDFGFSAKPGGRRLITGGFDGAGTSGYWLTSTKRDEPPYFYVWTMYSSAAGVEEDEGGADPEDGRYGDFRKVLGVSVRCVQNTNN